MKRLANWFVGWLFSSLSTPEQKKMVIGVTTDSTLHLSDIPVVLPRIGSTHTVATDLRPFEVVGGSRDTRTVLIMEQESSVVHSIDVELFDLLFVKSGDTTA